MLAIHLDPILLVKFLTIECAASSDNMRLVNLWRHGIESSTLPRATHALTAGETCDNRPCLPPIRPPLLEGMPESEQTNKCATGIFRSTFHVESLRIGKLLLNFGSIIMYP